MNIKTIFAAIVLTFSAVAASAGSFSIREYTNGNKFISFYGDIVESDIKRLQQIIRLNPNVGIIQLHSEGGDVDAGWEMARIIRDSGLNTAVGDNAICASACTYMFVGGATRYNHKNARIGFHPVTVTNWGDAEDYTKNEIYDIGQASGLEAAVNYLRYVDAGKEWDAILFIDWIYQNIWHYEMHWATSAELINSGISHQQYG